MTEAISVRTMRPAELRLIAGVCAAHLMSHYYMLMLAPLLAFVRDDFNVSYTQLALALTVFNVVSAVLQTPVGFLVDRVGARVVLIAGLALSSAAFAVAGLFPSYWVFIAMYGVAGIGNTAYHPSDYSLLSHHAPQDRLSQIFSFHTFAGMLGGAIAPVSLLFMQSHVRLARRLYQLGGFRPHCAVGFDRATGASRRAWRQKWREGSTRRHGYRLALSDVAADPSQYGVLYPDLGHGRRA